MMELLNIASYIHCLIKMLNRFFSLLIFALLFIQTFQQIVNTAPQTPPNAAQAPFQQFNDMLLRNLQEEEKNATQIENDMESKLQTQIITWTSIGLAFILYFIVMTLINMPNPKSSILYAKYDTTRAEHEL